MAVAKRTMFGRIAGIAARRSVQRAAISTVIFLTVFCGGAYFMRDQIPLFKWFASLQTGGSGAFANAGRQDLPTGGAGLSEDDPVRNFAKTGVGQVLFTATSSDNCRRNLFDNRTGATYEVGEIFCGQNPENIPESQSSDRLQSMRKPFKK
jgi:hypothetical protein